MYLTIKRKNIRDIYLNLEPYDLKLGTKFYIVKNFFDMGLYILNFPGG
jgi:hypothetical protein